MATTEPVELDRDVSTPTWHLIDHRAATFVAVPALRGITTRARVELIERSTREVVAEGEGEAGAVISLPLPVASPALADLVARLQRLDGERWLTVGSLVPLSTDGRLEVHAIAPSDWGIDAACRVMLRDLVDKRTLLREVIPAGHGIVRVIEFTAGRKLQLDFHEATDERIVAPARLLPPIRLVPHAQRGRPDPHGLDDAVSSLGVSVRHDVDLAPIALAKAGRGGLSTNGAIGASDANGPIVEAMEYVLGRQRYQYLDPVDALDVVEEPMIYAGTPHGSWGHFLTQGLSRLWYAIAHPEMPLLWDARALPAYQLAVLEALEIRNPHRFLVRGMRAREVHFPYPGVSLGDYVDADFARVIGRIEQTPVQPGKRLLLTRARLSSGRGTEQAGADRSLESIAAAHGFEPFAPEEHPLEVQLAELSSAEDVMGVEGSAFHTLLLLRGTPETRFWALTRHRGGSGVYQHIKTAKSLRYETLDFLLSSKGGAGATLEIDLDRLEEVLAATDGLRTRLELLEPHLEHPAVLEVRIASHLANTQVRRTPLERDMTDATQALRHRQADVAHRIVASYV